MPERPDLAAIRARVEAATPGEWSVWSTMDNTLDILTDAEHPLRPVAAVYSSDHNEGVPTDQEKADADFIGAARADIPALLAYIERLEAELAACAEHCRAGDGAE